MKLFRSGLLLLVAALPAASALNEKRGPGPQGFTEIQYTAHRLGTDHAEGVTTLDMNGDGKKDILSGAYWYENPGSQGGEWKRHQFRAVQIVTEFVSDCGEWTVDVNHDGAMDLVTTGWMTDGVVWYENPKKSDAMWERHFITKSIETEGGWMADLNGDGQPDLALAHYGRSGLIWIDFAGKEPVVHHPGGHDQDGHGVGIGDIDGDGKADLLSPFGWFKNIDATQDKWEWKADWNLGETGFPILTFDVNGDGKTDLIYGRGHSYGLYWMEQGDGGKWTQHTIDESFSQVHALKLVDLDGDGKMELLAGKRYRGHNGADPGSYDPLVIYYFRMDNGKFSRVPVSVNGTAAAGTQFVTEDIDGDGDIDIVTAGKTGVHLDENLTINKVPKATRENELHLDKKWPFPGEGENVPWQH